MNIFRPPLITPLPQPRTINSTAPPADGYLAPNFAYEYVENSAMMPPIKNESHIAEPAAAATTPKMENIPAPIMPPIPIDIAAGRLIVVLVLGLRLFNIVAPNTGIITMLNYSRSILSFLTKVFDSNKPKIDRQIICMVIQ